MARNTAESKHDVSLSVVIPTYRRAALLHRLLTALEAQVVGKPDRQVVVVNDGSHDEAYAKVVERFQSMIDYVALPQNRGMAAVRNAGSKRAAGDFLVFTDDDCEPPAHWLDWLVATILEHPYVAIVGGTFYDLPSESPGLVEAYCANFHFLIGTIYVDGDLVCLPAGNIAVRREWFEKLGGFDERYGVLGGEDVNLTYRLKKAGAPFRHDWSWITYHDHSFDLRTFCKRYFRYGYGNARHASLENDSTDYGFTPDRPVLSMLRTSLAHCLWRYKKEFRKVRPYYRALAYTFLCAIQYLSYQLGAARALKLTLQTDSGERVGGQESKHDPNSRTTEKNSVDIPGNVKREAKSGEIASNIGFGITVVIPTYRRSSSLHRLLTALEPQVIGKPDVQVVVVNDGSHDEAYAKVVERFRLMIDYVSLPANCGVAAARNTGVRKAKGRYIVFTDDDCVPPPHWLDWLVANLQEHPYAAVIGGLTRPLTSKSPGLIAEYTTVFGHYPKPIYLNGQLTCLPTANLAVRRDWFEKVCGFDERLRQWGEDADLTYRLKKTGAPFQIDWSWFTYHDQEYNLRAFCHRQYVYGRGFALQNVITGDPNYAEFPLPSSVLSILWGLPKTIGSIRNRRDRSTRRGYRRLMDGALDLLSELSFELGLKRGYKHAAEIVAKDDLLQGE